MIDFEAARAKMVDSQVRTTDVTSHSVLNALLSVPREDFVPPAVKSLAYIDEDLQIAPARDGKPPRYLMESSPLAKLLQLAAITKNDSVLEIGSGCGYTTALLSRLAHAVVAVECDSDLADQAGATLARSGYGNVTQVTGPLEAGYPAEGPYDLIFVNGAVEEVPETLLSQLREGGRLVAVVGYGPAAQARVFVRNEGQQSQASHFNAAIKPLPGFRKAAAFVF